MELLKLLPDYLTAVATVVLAVAAWIQLPSISKQVKLLSEQLRLARVAEENSYQRAREWETMRACGRYDYDPVLEAATTRIWTAAQDGTNYTNGKVQIRDAIVLLNYLDGLATGIEQNLYIEAMVKDHLGSIVRHSFDSFIRTQLVDTKGLEKFCELYRKWYDPLQKTDYASVLKT